MAEDDVPNMPKATLNDRVTALEAELQTVQKKIAQLSGMDLVMVRNLDVSTPKMADDVPNMPKEKEASSKAAVETTENATLKDRVTALEAENVTLKDRVTALEKGNAALKEENATLKAELQTVQKKIAQLSGMDLVMVRTMLEACRTKCRNLLSQRNVHILHDWNELICDATCIGVLKEAGLTIGLPATAYGKKSQQQKGSEVAHSIMECPEACATIVCKMDGNQRNVFAFVFGSRAEDLALQDI